MTGFRSMVVLGILMTGTFALAQSGPQADLNELYGKGQPEQALALGLDRLQQTPDDRDLNHLVGRCLVDLGRFAEGKPYLQKVVAAGARDWRYAWALDYLGRIAWVEGDDDAARRAWIEVRDGALTANVSRHAANCLRWYALDTSFADWRRLQTAHCIFHFSPAHAERDLQAFADEHEKAYEHLAAWFGGGTPWPVRIIVWGSLEEARSLSGISDLGFARPELCLVHCLWGQTTGHELAHVVSYQALKPAARTALVNEGLAVFSDLTGRDRLAMARQAVQAAGMKELDLAAWWEKAPADGTDVFYPVAGAWMQTLLDKGGKEKLLELCRDQTLGRARVLYGDDLDIWMKDFSAALLTTGTGD